MEKHQNNQYSAQNLGHLGILAGTLKKTKLVERIDKLLPVAKEKGANVTMGERTAAMIYNALGFIDSRLYMFSEFLSHKPVQKLLGGHLTSQDFTDDALGRCLDSIYDYGPSKFIFDVTFQIAAQLNLLGKSIHVDTTSLTLYGEYNKEEDKQTPPPNVTYGYAKNKRADLKQLILNLAINSKADLPVFMAAHDGNASDQKTLLQAAQTIEKCCKKLENHPNFIYIADSAAYESCLKQAKNLYWLTRVPAQRKVVKQYIQNRQEYKFTPIADGYKIHAQEKTIEGVKQRWLLVYSQQAHERAKKTLERAKEKEHTSVTKALLHLSNTTFNCAEDAQKALKELSKKWTYYQVSNIDIAPIQKYARQGRPKENAEKRTIGYHIKATVVENTANIASILDTKSHFVLATNQLNKAELSDEEILNEYKGQQKVERGFAFIKNSTFEVSSVFLKKPSRISALMAVMVLSLFVYSLTQYLLRETLTAKGESIPNQLKKETQKPTAKWVFFLFRSIQVLYIQTPNGGPSQALVINLTPLLERIISYFGRETMAIYEVTMPKSA